MRSGFCMVATESGYAIYGRDLGVGRDRGVGVTLGVVLGVPVGVTVAVAVGVPLDIGVAVAAGVAVAVGVALAEAVGEGDGPDCAQYLPPVFKLLPLPTPPQTIISLPLQSAVWSSRALGALVVLVAVQLSVLGSYLPPVFKTSPLNPPQTIILLPVHTAV